MDGGLSRQCPESVTSFRSPGLGTLPPPLVGFAERASVFGPRLAIEVVAGAVCFVPSALILAPTGSRQLLRMVRNALQRRRGS